MKTLLIATVLILLVLPSFASDLPPCPEGTYHNCFGTLTFPSGSKYVGDFKDSKRHGKGEVTWADGRKYAGEWKDDRWHGEGTFIYPDGSEYVGEFKDGKRFPKSEPKSWYEW